MFHQLPLDRTQRWLWILFYFTFICLFTVCWHVEVRRQVAGISVVLWVTGMGLISPGLEAGTFTPCHFRLAWRGGILIVSWRRSSLMSSLTFFYKVGNGLSAQNLLPSAPQMMCSISPQIQRSLCAPRGDCFQRWLSSLLRPQGTIKAFSGPL